MRVFTRTLQQVGKGLGPERHGPLGFVVGDGEVLHAQLHRHFGLRAVVDQRAAQKLPQNTNKTVVTHAVDCETKHSAIRT